MSQDQEILNAQLNLISTLIESTNATVKKGVYILDLPIEAKETLKSFSKDNDRFLAELRTCSDVPTLLSSLPKLKSSADQVTTKLQSYNQHSIIKDTLEANQSTLEGVTNVERLLEQILKGPSSDDNSTNSPRKKKKERRDKKERRRSDKKGKKTKNPESTAESDSDSDNIQDSKSEFLPQTKEYEFPSIPSLSVTAPQQEQQPPQELQTPAHTPAETEAPPSPCLDSKEDHSSSSTKGWKVGTWGRSGERTRSPSSSRRMLNSRGESELGISPRSGSFFPPPTEFNQEQQPNQSDSQPFVHPSLPPSNFSSTSPKLVEPAEQTPQSSQTTHESSTPSEPQQPQSLQEVPNETPSTGPTSKPVEPSETKPTPATESKEPPSPLDGSPLASPLNSPRTAQRKAVSRGNSDAAIYRGSLMITPQQMKELTFQSPIADVNPQEEESRQNVDNVQVEVVVVKEQSKPATLPAANMKPVLEELLLYDKNGGFDLEDWNYKLDSLIRACSVTIHNHTNYDLQLGQEQHENFEWLNPPPSIIPTKRKVIFGTFSRNLFGNSKANIFYSAEGKPNLVDSNEEGIEDKIQFTWESQKNSSKIDKVVAYVNFPFKCDKEVSQKRKHTEATFTITESEIRPRASTFGSGLEL